MQPSRKRFSSRPDSSSSVSGGIRLWNSSSITTLRDAARIAGLVAGVSRNPDDQQDINADERSAYRELINSLQLENNELEEIEFSVRQELTEGKSLLQIIGDALFGKGSWPDQDILLKTPEIPGLG